MNEVNYITPWANKRSNDPLHSLCSYLGSFPPSLASYFIRFFTDEGDLVYDPFSGRGTTILEARILNRKSVASDLNPIALALSHAKSVQADTEAILQLIDELEENYDYPLFLPEAKAQPDEIHLIFHPRTLAELCYLKLMLKEPKSKEEKILVGTILGIMHGGERKDGSSGYLSISMPNTFSMSPEYVRRFVQTNQLNREYRNTFQLLREKIKRTFEKHTFPRSQSSIYRSDAKTLSSTPEFKKLKGKVDLILTSPPYLGIVNYARQNWIRSWFLDANPELISEELDDDLNLFEWIKFSKDTVSQFKKLLKPNGVGVFVIGDVAKSKDSVIPLAREFAVMVKENKLFKNVWIFSDYIQGFDKTTRIWGETKGKATATDRIVILSDINPFKENHRLNGESDLTYDLIKESTKHFMGDRI
ncbi:DNA methyltransferase [Algoriphagus machipongonensis]|uniref:Methyltransferase n=1 Tax=Algoriphagus machipongonensis TaxID=388413 RepID=A3HWI4_9BACT|nr:DNA methyltransferase [Algoriphagus machipongonensis]EAZ80957.1 putative type II R/M system [Algoriphagus machipongonensis]